MQHLVATMVPHAPMMMFNPRVTLHNHNTSGSGVDPVVVLFIIGFVFGFFAILKVVTRGR